MKMRWYCQKIQYRDNKKIFKICILDQLVTNICKKLYKIMQKSLTIKLLQSLQKIEKSIDLFLFFI